MGNWRKIIRRRKLIGFLLITALAFLTVLPAHVHLHHVEVGAGASHQHEHLLDMHVYSSDLSSSHHDEAQVLMATPDGMLKSLDFKISPSLILALLVSIFSLAIARFVPRQKSELFLPTNESAHLSPPLRGPPQ